MSVEAILLVGAFLLGSIVGSFINALSFRFNTGRGIIWDGPSTKLRASRSRCMHCNHVLHSIDLVPVLSYLWLGGKCRYCHSSVSVQYPLVEIVAALLSVLVYLKHPVLVGTTLVPLSYVLWLVVWMTLLFIVLYDLKHTIIPWSASGLLLAISFFMLFFSFDALTFTTPTLIALLSGPLLALPLFLLSLVSKGTWMGWGDSPLQLSLGWLLGAAAGATGLMLAFWVGAAWGLGLLLLSRLGFFGYTIKSEIPFAPFLILGAGIAYFFNVDFFSSLAPLF